jgi:hypothetical protein
LNVSIYSRHRFECQTTINAPRSSARKK